MEKSKKLLRTVVAFMMILSMLPIASLSINAEVEERGTAGAGGPIEPVAVVGDTNYNTLQDAINASTDGNVITLIADITSAVNTIVNKNVTVDLNGHTIQTTNLKDAFSIKANVVIKDSSDVNRDGSGTGKIYTVTDYAKGCGYGTVQIKEDAQLTLESGYIYAVRPNAYDDGQFGVVLSSGSKFIMNGGKVEAGWYAVSGNGNDKTKVAQTTINGGKLISTADYALYHPQNGVLTINGGSIEGYAGGISVNRGTVNINGGTIIGKGLGDTGEDGDGTSGQSNFAINFQAKYGAITAKITNGIIKASGDAMIINQGTSFPTTLEVTGGNFSSDPSNYLGSVYKAYSTNGTYTVAPKATGITLDKTSLNMETGNTAQLTATVSPNGTLDKVTYKSSNTNVATVDANGKITAKAVGTTTITATAGDKNATCAVKVYKVEAPVIPTLPTKPVDKPTVGVTDSKAVEVISETASNLIDSIVNGGTVDTSIISTAVQEKIIEAMAAGKEITTKVESTPIDAAKVEKAVVTKVENAIKKLETANKSEIVIAQYLDLGIALEAEGTKLGNINKLEEPIKFTVALPSELKVEGRKYYVVRIHGEETTLIEATLNEDGTLTFETDEFSMYALVYEDVKLETPTPAPTPDSKPGVDTGDTSNATMLLIMLVAAGSLGVYTTKRRMRKN